MPRPAQDITWGTETNVTEPTQTIRDYGVQAADTIFLSGHYNWLARRQAQMIENVCDKLESMQTFLQGVAGD